MRFMMFMYPEISEEEWDPSAEDVAEMSRYNEELRKAGMLLSLDGLHPPGEGARVSFDSEGTSSVTDGPFAEAKEVVGGYSVLDVRSHEEAVEGARRMMQIHLDHWPGWEGSCDVRRISGREEGPPTS